MTKSEKSIYIELLKAALWEHEVDTNVFKGDWSWNNLLCAFRNQDLLGVVANKIMLLPEDLRPSLPETDFILGHLGALIQAHRLLNVRIADVMPRLESVGCKPILLKGQGLSTLFPGTCYRSCGDLDIYVGSDTIEAAKDVVNSMASEKEREEAVSLSHHYNISIKGITYEIHQKLGVAGNRSYKKEFNECSCLYLKSLLCDKASLQIAANKYVQVDILPLEMNVWYVFNHLMEHFTDSGVCLRQFCDWLLIVHEYYKKYGKTKEVELKSVLSKIGLLRAWKILGGILVYQLGLPEEEYPLFDERLAKKSQGFIIDDMLEGIRFRFASYDKIDGENKGLKHKLNALRYYYYDSRPLYVLSPLKPYTYFCKFLIEDFKHTLFSKKQ